MVIDGLLLIQRRSPDRAFLPDAWDVIGGAIDPGESPADALVREVREETGLEVEAIGPWLTDVSFSDGACREIGALVRVRPGAPRLERGKASAFALVDEIESFVRDNEMRGWGSQLRSTAGVALSIVRSGMAL